MKSHIAHVSSRRLFRALNIESNLARPVIIQIPTQSPGRYTAELPLRRIKLFSFQANSPYVPSTHTLWIFWGLAGWKLRLRPLRFFSGLGSMYSVLRYFGTRVPIVQYSSVLGTHTFKKYLYSYLYSSTF